MTEQVDMKKVAELFEELTDWDVSNIKVSDDGATLLRFDAIGDTSITAESQWDDALSGDRAFLRIALDVLQAFPALVFEVADLRERLAAARHWRYVYGSNPYGVATGGEWAELDGILGLTKESPTPKPADALRDRLAEALGDAYLCTRVWEAWQYGTMTQDDFCPAWEDDELLDSLVRAAQSPAPDQVTREDQLVAASIIDAYGHLVVDSTQRERRRVIRDIRALLRAEETER